MERSRISRSVIGGEVNEEDWVRRSIPERSAWWKRSSQGMGTKTQFSGFGKTPTGELEKQIRNLFRACGSRDRT